MDGSTENRIWEEETRRFIKSISKRTRDVSKQVMLEYTGNVMLEYTHRG